MWLVFLFFLMVFNFLIIVGIIKNISIFYNNNLEKYEIIQSFNSEENNFNKFFELNEENYFAKNENAENNSLIKKSEILKKLTFIFDFKNLFFDNIEFSI